MLLQEGRNRLLYLNGGLGLSTPVFGRRQRLVLSYKALPVLIYCFQQEEPPSTKVQQQDAIKIDLPVLCEEDGTEVLRFSELFGLREPYWVLGNKTGRSRRHSARGFLFHSAAIALLFLACISS
jgi:hypothetical protein